MDRKFLWAGIDEAGYGPLLGPLVVATSWFYTHRTPEEGLLWDELSDAICKQFRGADGRLVVADSKRIYGKQRGLKPLEDGVISFLLQDARRPGTCGELFETLLPSQSPPTETTPWFRGVTGEPLPLTSNWSSIDSKRASLEKTFEARAIEMGGIQASVTLPGEFNKIVARTDNKSYLLWQRCGELLQMLWEQNQGTAYILVDRHGGRLRYRKLLHDVFPELRIQIIRENTSGSVYRLRNEYNKEMWVAFKKSADDLALPVSLASMTAKYLREIYMHTFNQYWQQHMPELKPTAGYAADAKRFLKDIKSLIQNMDVDLEMLVRNK